MDFPQRKRIRLKDYDYSSNGAYFITICTQHRLHLLGEINVGQAVGQGLCSCRCSCRPPDIETRPPDNGTRPPDIETRPPDIGMHLSDIGSIVYTEIQNLETRYENIEIDKYVIMPNHVHLLLRICEERRERQERQEQSPCPTTSVCDAICALKSITSKRANTLDNLAGRKIWQFRFHDHIIRNEKEYQKIWQYIDTNPLHWQEDCFYQKETVLL